MPSLPTVSTTRPVTAPETSTPAFVPALTNVYAMPPSKAREGCQLWVPRLTTGDAASGSFTTKDRLCVAPMPSALTLRSAHPGRGVMKLVGSLTSAGAE